MIYRHRSIAQAKPEAGFAADVLGLGKGDLVLDVACGEGRHVRSLRDLGIRAMGMDLSPELLATARGEGHPVVRGDMRRIPFRGAFSAVVSFFTSFGYFESDEENLGVLSGMAGCLVDGGKVLLDLPNRSSVESRLVPRSEREEGGRRIVEERSMEGDRVVKRILVSGEEFIESVRLFTLDEMREGMVAAGLELTGTYGSFGGEEYGEASDRMILTGRLA